VVSRQFIKSDQSVIIFGAGNTGEKFAYKYFNQIKICCFWDNQKTGEFLGYPVYRPERNSQKIIIVASNAYFEIRAQLIDMGYEEFHDFIPFQIFRKKMAVAYGNCHMDVIRRYLQHNKEFASEYGFYPFPQIQRMNRLQFEYDKILQNCDLFFHQSIRKNNRYGAAYSSENMLQYVKETCNIISVPNLYGLPKYLFPQLDMQYDGPVGNIPPFFVDNNIKAWLKMGKSKKEIMSYILFGGVYSKREIIIMWEDFQRKLGKREKEWDIKISDYIFSNYQKEKLFNDTNHITSKMAKEIAVRILKYMGYQTPVFLESPSMDALEVFVYHDVKEALGLAFEEKFIRKYSQDASLLSGYEMDLEEYIEQLCQYTIFLEDYENRVINRGR